MKTGEKLKELRIEAGLSRSALSKLVDYNVATISRWENNVMQPTGKALASLADALHCSMDYLAERENDEGNIQIKYTGYVPDDDELDLLFDYKKLSNAQKQTVRSVIKTFINE